MSPRLFRRSAPDGDLSEEEFEAEAYDEEYEEAADPDAVPDEEAVDEASFEEALEEGRLSEAEEAAALGAELEEELVEEEAERAALAEDHGPRRVRFAAFRRLYRGQTSFDFVGRKRWWFLLSGAIILAGLIAFGIRGQIPLGIEFKGGTSWTLKANGVTQTQVQNAMTTAGLTQSTVELLGNGTNQQVQVQADLKDLNGPAQQAETAKVTAALAALTHTNPSAVSIEQVGPTWGSQVTQKALIGLLVFFVVVGVYISFRFEPKMALAAFIAMVHDLLVTLSIYLIAGFQVSPDTVVAVLTVLGYSLYDTVVVFDRVRDNTKGLGASGRMTYSEMINLSMNQTLARSINTSLVAILPVLAVLVVGAEILGAKTLQDYGLALTVGLFSGAYSSIFIASPVLAIMKERESRYKAIRRRLEQRGEGFGAMSPAAAAALVSGGGGAGRPGRSGGGPAKGPKGRPAPAAKRTGPLRPGQAKTRTAGPGRASTATLEAATNGEDGGVPAAGDGGTAGPLPVRRPASATGRPPPRPRKGSKNRKRR